MKILHGIIVQKEIIEQNVRNLNPRGVLCVFGSFLIQLTLGAYHGTFGNMVPYFSSYMKQVRNWSLYAVYLIVIIQFHL